MLVDSEANYDRAKTVADLVSTQRWERDMNKRK